MSTIFKKTRSAALAAGDMFYETGDPCRNGHVTKRYVRGGMCHGCLRMHRRMKRKREIARVKRHSAEHPDMFAARVGRWRAKNRHKVNAIAAKRRAAKMHRTPTWLSREHIEQIDLLYAESVRLTAETGEKYHVDHIVPLQGRTVSGLHVPWNLRVIPASENLRKHNKFEDGSAYDDL